MKRFLSVVTAITLLTAGLAMGAPVLLIPESTADSVGMYDPYDGTYLGDFIPNYAGFGTPINAVQGPNGNIFVSDQIADAVFEFDSAGVYVQTYADASDGLNNVRGIDFYNGWLYVTSGDDYVAAFSAPHVRETDFINDGSDPFDIYFIDDGSALLSDIQGTTDNVRLYLPDGTLSYEIFSVSFPEQIQKLPTGDFINASFSDNLITTFNLSTVTAQVSFSGGRGAFILGNGNLIATNGDGVFEVDKSTGTIISTLRSGVSARFIEVVDLPLSPTPTPTLPPEPTATPTPPEPTPTPTSECINDGDVTLDGEITAGDAQLAFLIALGAYAPSFEEECAADCNGNGEVTAGDAQQIFLTALGSATCVDPILI